MTDTITEPNTDEPFGDEIVMLPGWPGYRTRPDRTGLDYLDTQFEIAHMCGVFLRKILTNRMHMGNHGPSLFVTWLIAIALWLGLSGGAVACPGVLLVVSAGIFIALRDWFAQKARELTEEK